MNQRGYPKFVNDDGLPEIRIGAREFECMGATPPHDHPHIYLDMGNDAEIRCPYCGTLFRHDPALGRAAADATARYVTGAEYRFVELNAGHWLPERRPAEVAAAVVDRVTRASAG